MDYKTIERAISTLVALNADLKCIKDELKPNDYQQKNQFKEELILATYYIDNAAAALDRLRGSQ